MVELIIDASNSTFTKIPYGGFSHRRSHMRKGTTSRKTHFLPFFKLSPFEGLKSPRLPTWFIGSLDLLLHISVRSYSKPPVPSSEPPK